MVMTEEHRANALAISKKQLKELRKRLGIESMDSRMGSASTQPSDVELPKDFLAEKCEVSSVKK